MKVKVLSLLMLVVFILSGISSASAQNYEDVYDSSTIKQGDTFTITLFNGIIDKEGYDSKVLTLVSEKRNPPNEGYVKNIYIFKAKDKGITTIKAKVKVLWWKEERRLVTVNVI